MKDYKETRRHQEPLASFYFVAKKGYDPDKQEGLRLSQKDTWIKGDSNTSKNPARKLAEFDFLDGAISKYKIAPKHREIYGVHPICIDFECGSLKGFRVEYEEIKVNLNQEI